MVWRVRVGATSLRTSVWAWWKALLARKTDNTQLINLDSAEEGDMDVATLATLSWPEQIKHGVYDVALERLKTEEEKIIEKAKAEELSAFRGILKNMLRIKFGEVPPLVLQRIDQSAQADLECWIERSVTAPTLAALFGDDAAPVQAGRT